MSILGFIGWAPGLRRGCGRDAIAPAFREDALAVPDAVLQIKLFQTREITGRRPDLARQNEVAVPIRFRKRVEHPNPVQHGCERVGDPPSPSVLQFKLPHNRHMIAGPFAVADEFVDAHIDDPVHRLSGAEQVINADTEIIWPGTALVVPE